MIANWIVSYSINVACNRPKLFPISPRGICRDPFVNIPTVFIFIADMMKIMNKLMKNRATKRFWLKCYLAFLVDIVILSIRVPNARKIIRTITRLTPPNSARFPLYNDVQALHTAQKEYVS
jgi:hypothetical protein